MKPQTQTAKHTQGKLEAIPEQYEYHGGAFDLVIKQKEIAVVSVRYVCDNQAKANAERLALCWNQHDQLIAQRDALLEACKFVMKYHHMHLDKVDGNELPFQLSDAVQAAIALCEPKEKEASV